MSPQGQDLVEAQHADACPQPDSCPQVDGKAQSETADPGQLNEDQRQRQNHTNQHGGRVDDVPEDLMNEDTLTGQRCHIDIRGHSDIIQTSEDTETLYRLQRTQTHHTDFKGHTGHGDIIPTSEDTET